MQTDQHLIAIKWHEMLQAEIDRLRTVLENGFVSFDEYKKHVGEIAGLRKALKYMDDAAKDVAERMR